MAMGDQITFMDQDGTASGLLTATNAELRLSFEDYDQEAFDQGYRYAYYTGQYSMTCTNNTTYVGKFLNLLCNSQSYNSLVGLSSQDHVGMWDEDSETGIEEVLQTMGIDTTQPMYNILGQPVDMHYKGIILQDGKKFLVR